MFARLTVSDTGVGIPEHELPRLFERFHRIEGQKSRTYEGSGIGLALVQELVKLNGGTIRADSGPGQGTAFTITIPFGTAHLPQDRIGADGALSSTSVRAEAYVEEALRWLPDAAPFADSPSEYEPGNELPPTGEGAYILVADDNADMRAYVRQLLGAKCKVEAVGDGQAALKAIRKRRPDLVIADVMMPGLDGFDLLREIRADPGLRDIPVIMLSARAGEESRVEGLEAGADDYLVKPFSARDLLARVGGNLKLTKLRQQAEYALRESESRLKLAVEIGGLGHWTLDLQTLELTTSALCRRNFGRAADDPFSYEDLRASIHPEDRERQMLAVGAAIENRAPFEVEYRAFTPQGDLRHIEVRGRFETESGRDRLVGVSLDLTERKRAEDALRASEERYRHLVEQTPDGIFLADREGRYIDVNPAGCEMLRMTREEVLGSIFTDVIAPEEHHRLPAEIARFDDGSIVSSEWHMRSKDGSVFNAEIVGRRLPNGNLQGIVRDVTERKRAEQALHQRAAQLKLLLDELNHRVKNTLATVQSIAMQTLRTAATPADGRQSLESRLVALSKAHDVLTREHWEGADIHEIVSRAIGPYTRNGGLARFEANGPEIRLLPKAALALSMALHELATNAVKYGALSNEAGRVRIGWHATADEARLFRLEWVEQSGPPVKKPTRRGFGSRLIERGLAQDLDGDVRLSFEPEGLACTIEAPMHEVHGTDSRALSRIGTQGD